MIICSLPIIERSKIQKKNKMQIFLTFYYLGRTVDEVLSAGGDFLAEPAGAAFFEDLEEEVAILFERETVAGMEVVESERYFVGVVVGIIVV